MTTLNCIITCEGHRTRSKKGLRKQGRSFGNTVRPLNDQTRPVSGFFKGMGVYGTLIADHVIGCKECTPNQVAEKVLSETTAATMKPWAMLKKLFRRDPRADKMLLAKAIGAMEGAEAIYWLAKYASPEEFWQGLRGIALRQTDYSGKGEAWWVSNHRRHRSAKLPARDVMQGDLRNMVMVAEAIGLANQPIPETWGVAKDLLPAVEVHSS